jgi:hypothetical protein
MTTSISSGHVADQVERVVKAANDRGMRVAGEWGNVSRCHPIDLPAQGATSIPSAVTWHPRGVGPNVAAELGNHLGPTTVQQYEGRARRVYG